MSINYNQLEQFIERLYSNFANYEGATQAFMMCAAHESKGGEFLMQSNLPPLYSGDYGRGIVQIQENLHDDVLEQVPRALAILNDNGYRNTKVNLCIHDIKYSALIFRLHFMRFSHNFPSEQHELGRYLKQYWNSKAGAASGTKYVNDYLEWKS